jgi:DNA-binding transcriptional regulator YiaG
MPGPATADRDRARSAAACTGGEDKEEKRGETMQDGEVTGAEIRDLRKRLGLTQEEFAHAVAVTFSTVNRWENGHAKPSKLARRAIEALANPKTNPTSGSHTIEELAASGTGTYGPMHK